MTVDDRVLVRPIHELAAGLRAGKYTSVELTEAYIERLETVGETLNAVVTVTRERALRRARQLDAELDAGEDRGPLHGIPYGAKDLLAAEGYPTTWGAAPLRDQRFDYDATVVRRLAEAGAVLVAKLAMVELAGGLGYEQADASFTGPGRNPWNLDAWTCGSSSGPAAAVPAGLVGFAIGSETYGSVVCPSAFSGAYGFRPTYGRVSRYGAMTLSYTMDKLGPLCRSAGGCETVLRAIAGPDERDETTVHRPLDPSGGDRGEEGDGDGDDGGSGGASDDYRIAVLEGAADEAQAAVRKNYERSLDVFREFATVETVSLPAFPYPQVGGLVIDAEAASAFEGLVESGAMQEMTAPADRVGPYAQQAVLAKDYLDAMRVRTEIQRAVDETLAPYDALVAPAEPAVANPIDVPFFQYLGEYGAQPTLGASNVAGLPGLSLPNGFGERNLPTGLVVVGRAFADVEVLGVAQEYVDRTDHVDYADLLGELC